MADVEVKYRGQIIRSMSASGTEVLHTKEKYCDDDITIDYTSPGGGGANLQTKSVSYTPDETGISDTILPDPGYDGMDEVDVTVDPIPDTYVGSAVPQRDSSDLLVTGRLVRAPAGYYASMAGAQVAMGTEGTPTASKGAVSNHSVDVTPSVTNGAGYINGGTQTGTPVTVSASELVSGSQTVTVNDTYDVTNLAEMVVNVSGGGGVQGDYVKIHAEEITVGANSVTNTQNLNTYLLGLLSIPGTIYAISPQTGLTIANNTIGSMYYTVGQSNLRARRYRSGAWSYVFWNNASYDAHITNGDKYVVWTIETGTDP